MVTLLEAAADKGHDANDEFNNQTPTTALI